MIIELKDLSVTQNGFRDAGQINDMIDFVAKEGFFNHAALIMYSEGKDTRKIAITRFEDGRLFIHDGHHRVAAIYLGGRKYLSPEEFKITDRKYSDYMEINLAVGWVTPLDPRTHVRIADYEDHKRRVRFYQAESEAKAKRYIDEAKMLGDYLKPRTVLTIQDLLRYI